MAIETGVTLSVYADHDYRFDVEVSDEFSVVYVENGKEGSRVSFGSLDEMEAVAKAMLKAIKLAKED